MSKISTKEISNLRNEKGQLQKEMSEQEGKLKKNKASVRDRLNKLMILNSEISSKQKTIHKIENDINILSSDITIMKKNLDTLEMNLKERQQRYTMSMRHLQKQRGKQSNLNFILSASSFSEMVRRMRFLKEYAQYQRKKGEEIKAKHAEVSDHKRKLEKKKDDKDQLLNKGKQEERELQGKKEEQRKVVSSLQKEQKEIQSVLAEQKKKNAQINAKIDQLIAIEVEKIRKRAEAEARKKAELEAKRRAAEAARKKAEAEAKRKAALEAAAKRKAAEEYARKKAAEAEAAAARAAAAKGGNAKEMANAEAEAKRKASEAAAAATAAAAAAEAAAASAKASESAAADAKSYESMPFVSSSEDTRISGSFENNKGRLPMPITGPYRIVSHFGQYNVEGLKNVRLDNKGINIQGRAGARARSIFDGEVSAVFSLEGTIIVMVRHGNYISVYCNLSSASVSRGQKVSARQ
ncbi:MAG: peptidoglycan DD-metalloendopeptidase family protein, partial [Prevotellaceae bacterium]|nr:peptidoglycan DD-metalloendopeptidase family protein [Prevotellaceae bacterium]